MMQKHSTLGLVPGFDTNKILVTISYHFFLRSDLDRYGFATVYLSASQSGRRVRINLQVKGRPDDWNSHKQRFKENSKLNQDANLVLANIHSRVSETITIYRISNRNLTLKKFVEEFYNAVPRAEFLSFFAWALENRVKPSIKSGTYRKHKSVLQKLQGWRDEIPFHTIDKEFMKELRRFLRKNHANATSTVNGNISVIKRYINLANDMKIPLTISPNEIVVGSTAGNKNHLKPHEVRKLREFYFLIDSEHLQKKVVGYFLFSCFTGLRLSDVKALDRSQVEKETFSFVPKKTAAFKNYESEMAISPLLRQIIDHCPRLFTEKWPSDQYINRELKEIARVLRINNKISFHSARHTFATNYLRTGGKVERLKVLLGHSNITTTMAYVHIVENEVMDDVLELDTVY